MSLTTTCGHKIALDIHAFKKPAFGSILLHIVFPCDWRNLSLIAACASYICGEILF